MLKRPSSPNLKTRTRTRTRARSPFAVHRIECKNGSPRPLLLTEPAAHLQKFKPAKAKRRARTPVPQCGELSRMARLSKHKPPLPPTFIPFPLWRPLRLCGESPELPWVFKLEKVFRSHPKKACPRSFTGLRKKNPRTKKIVDWLVYMS